MIGVSGVTFASFNAIVGSGIFVLPALVAALLGPAAILAYLVCIVLIGLVGLCLAEAGSRVSSAGGLYGYARVSFGPVVGGIAGTLTWFANCVAAGAAIANFLFDTLAVIWPAMSGALARVVFLATIYLLLAAANIRGTRFGARLSVATALIKLTPLALLIIAGAFAIKSYNLRWVAVPSVATLGQGTMLLLFAFVGVENGLSTSGETVNPARTIPRAILWALAMVAALYIGLQLVTQGVLGAQLPNSTVPVVETATAVFGPWGTRLFVIATTLSAAGYLTADMLCSPRCFYALAEAGQLPRRLAAVHPRFATPAIAIGTYSLLCFIAAALGSFRELAVISASGTLILYLMCCLGLLRLRARDIAMAGKPFRAPGGAFVPLAATAISIWMLSTLAWREFLVGLCTVVVSGIVYGVRQRRLTAAAPLAAGEAVV